MFNIVGVISFTWTSIKLFAATLLYAATFLGRARVCRARVCDSVRDNDEEVWRDAELRVGPLNGRPKRVMSRVARVCGAAGMIPEAARVNGDSIIEKDWSAVFSSSIVSATPPTGCWSSRKSIHG
ncbi:hypothetical protein HD554DRAFT_2118777 [Boletus coccyginus]|nr:hypothetical protein HD554DRAFT_2118777 [Boletus coccyginus]